VFKSLLLNQRLVFCFVITIHSVLTTIVAILISGGLLSPALTKLHVLFHLLLNGLFHSLEFNCHIIQALFKGLMLVFQFFLVFVLYLDLAKDLNTAMYLSDEVFEELGVTVELASEVSVVTVCAQFVSLNKIPFRGR